MPDKNSTLHKASAFVSIMGHPLLTVAIFVLFLCFTRFNGPGVIIVPIIIIGMVIIPLTAWNYHKTLNGTYSNFDVSVQHQRKSFYLVSISLLLLAAILLHLAQQPVELVYGMLFALVMMIVSFLVNFFIKASLHTSVSFLLAFSMMTLHFWIGIGLIAVSCLIAGSRLILKRHTLTELLAGAIIGGLAGGGLYSYLLHN